jgi:2-dehydro-3-deoxygluconokinase
MTRIACIGEAMIELSLQGQTAQVGVAGDTLNTAIYLKRCAPGLAVDYVSCVGDDPFSDQIEAFIAAQEVGTAALTRIAGKSPGLYAITTSPEGERSFTYWRSASAARLMFQRDSGCDFSSLEHYDVLYLSGISIAILPHEVRAALLDWLGQSTVKLAYDSNYRPRLWEDQKTARDVTAAFWKRADICLPSIDDEMALFSETANEVSARFRASGARGALKRGPLGPLSLGETVDQTYPPAETVIDTTAAGDSFNGGYLAGLLSGESQTEALRRGHDCAAKVVAHRGAIIPREAM